MSSPNVELIRSLYSAFAAGDVAAVLGCMSPDIVWMEAESNPYADGNPYVGPQSVVQGVFARLMTEWEGFAAVPEELLDAGETVVAVGRYLGTCKATGRDERAQIFHIWRIAGGKVTRFDQFVDTLQLARVMGKV